MNQDPASRVSDDQVAAVRAFNRFYTRKLGVLDQQLLQSPFSLSEARVLYELAYRDDASAKEIGSELGLDAGYLSRILQSFDEGGLITRKPAASDRRQSRLGLTAKGRQAFAKLERRTQEDVAAMLAGLPRGGSERLVAAMSTIERLLGEPGISPSVHRSVANQPHHRQVACGRCSRSADARRGGADRASGTNHRAGIAAGGPSVRHHGRHPARSHAVPRGNATHDRQSDR